MPDVGKAVYATGRRKHAVARVWLQPGTGKIAINNRTLEDYFGRETSRMVFRQALELTETSGRFDVFVNVSGGASPARRMRFATACRAASSRSTRRSAAP
jgi:ribosomal protein S9